MKAVIWDLDGTLLNSYRVIVESLQLALLDCGVNMAQDDIWKFVIQYSSKALIDKLVDERGISADSVFSLYSKYSAERYLQIIPMENAIQILEHLNNEHIQQFVYTHRGKTTLPVLNNLGMTGYFTEILTSLSGFARKPYPDAIEYLISKYGLDTENTYYIGDRSLDMQCAQNASIAGILYLPAFSKGIATGAEQYIVNDLMEIAKIL